MTNDKMTIDELIELGYNPQKKKEFVESMREKIIRASMQYEILDFVHLLEDLYKEKVDNRYAYKCFPHDGWNEISKETICDILDYDVILWFENEICTGERTNPLDEIKLEKAKEFYNKLEQELKNLTCFNGNFVIEIEKFFRQFCTHINRNGKQEGWYEMFDIIYELTPTDSLLVRIKKKYRHEYDLILRRVALEAINWFC